MAGKVQQLIDTLEPVALEKGLELVTVEVAGTRKNPVLRVYLDTLAGGITLDELARAQEWVDAVVEELDPFEDAYTLEVSSPGIDRPLRTRAHFERFAGQECVVCPKKGHGQGNVRGVLLGMQGDDVVVQCDDGQRLSIAIGYVRSAHIIGHVDFGGARALDGGAAASGQV